MLTFVKLIRQLQINLRTNRKQSATQTKDCNGLTTAASAAAATVAVYKIKILISIQFALLANFLQWNAIKK